MTALDHTNASTTTAANNPGQARPNRLLSVVRGSGDDRNFHLSPMLQQIRDDGPAALNGELLPQDSVSKRGRARPAKEAAPAQPAAAAGAAASGTALQTAAFEQFLHFRNWFWILLFSTLVLSVVLSGTVVYAWNQQSRVTELESRLQVLQQTPANLTADLSL